MPQMLESTQLYEMAANVVVIDHHRKGVAYIDNSVIFYHEPYASSASELVTAGRPVPPPDGGRKHRPHHADRPFFQRGHPGPGR